MDNDTTQPDSTGQEADNSVAPKLGLDHVGLKSLLGSFLNEEEQSAPAPVEQQETPEETDTSEEDVDHSEEVSDQPEADESSLSKGVQKRINKLVAAKKAAQAELDVQKATLVKLQAELESAKNSTPVKQQDISQFVESLDTTQRVEEEYGKALEVLMWCEDNIDGGVIPLPNGEEQELTSSEVRAMKKVAMKRKEIELPQRMRFLQQVAAAEPEIAQNFPWWNKPETEEYQVAQQVLKEFPELKKRRADWKHVAGLVVLGAKAYAEMQTKKKSGVPAPIKRAPAQPSVRAVPAASTQSDLLKARQNFAKNSSDKGGLSDLVKAMGLV
jgi:hypothetical protein